MSADDKHNKTDSSSDQIQPDSEAIPEKDKDDLVSRLATAAVVAPIVTVLVDAATNSALASSHIPL